LLFLQFSLTSKIDRHLGDESIQVHCVINCNKLFYLLYSLFYELRYMTVVIVWIYFLVQNRISLKLDSLLPVI